MIKFRKWIVGIVVILLVTCFILFMGDKRQPNINTASVPALEQSQNANSTENLEESLNSEDPPLSALATKYQVCKSINRNFEENNSDWLQNEKPSWQTLLDEGSTLDDVTLAIEYFKNSNFAAEFRVEQLRANSSLTKINQSIMDEARASRPDVFTKDSGLSMGLRVPDSRLKNFKALPADKLNSLLSEVAPSIDDIAYFITQPEYTDDDIISLLQHTKNPRQTVGYGKIEALSLVDYAVDQIRVKVVMHLFDMGAIPTDDAYLGSTMERALARLYYNSTGTTQDQAAKIVQLVQNNGGRARFNEQSTTLVVGQFPRNSYNFDAESLQEYQTKYALDLTLISPRQALEIDKNSELIQRLLENRNDYFFAKTGAAHISLVRSGCRETLASFDGLWKPLSPYNLIEQTIEDNTQTPESIEGLLTKVDPRLVDMYRNSNKPRSTSLQAVPSVNKLFRSLNKGTILEVIDAFLKLSLQAEQKNWVVMQILAYDTSYFDELKNSELMLNEPEYFYYKAFNLMKYENIKKLYESGANLFSTDSLGKPLLYYAAENQDLKLLNYMYEESFPFPQDDLGEDPLHVVLKKMGSSMSAKNNLRMYGLVDALMKFKPRIDNFHLSRMALLQIVEPYNYQKIVTDYPELTPNDDTPLPAIQ